MIFRILLLSCLIMGFGGGLADHSIQGLGSAAIAGGGADDNTGTAATKPKTGKNKDDSAKRIKEGRALVAKLLKHLERHARGSRLRSMALDINQIRYLRANLDKAYDLLDDTKYRNDPQKVYSLLTEYTKSKDKKLSYYARNLGHSVAAERWQWRAEDYAHDYDAAKGAGKDIKAIDLKIKYQRARARYHEHAKKVDKPIRDLLFDPLPKTPNDH